MPSIDGRVGQARNKTTFWQCLERTEELAPDLAPVVKSSLQLLQGVARTFQPEEIALSFNGGKDATVVFHLIRAVFEAAYAAREPKPRIQAVFFEEPDPRDQFPEVLEFISEWSRLYANELELVRVPGGIFHGLRTYLTQTRPRVRCFLLGTRWTDPDGPGQEHLSPSSPQWPAFLRVNPLLHWSYRAVWRFLRVFGLEYCSLYDAGYTSIGRVSDTERNPQLRREDTQFDDFTHLERDEDERRGRKRRQPASLVASLKRNFDEGQESPVAERYPNWIGLLLVGTDPSRWFDGIIRGNAVSMFLRALDAYPSKPQLIQVVPNWLDGLTVSIEYTVCVGATAERHATFPVWVLAYDGSGCDTGLLITLVRVLGSLCAETLADSDHSAQEGTPKRALSSQASASKLGVIVLPLGLQPSAPASVAETLHQAMEYLAASGTRETDKSPFLADRKQVRISTKQAGMTTQTTRSEALNTATLFDALVCMNLDHHGNVMMTVTKDAYGRFLEVLEHLGWPQARI
ncbi:hypothetical protein CCYA_CCYA14G3667 [Cyanidiococcus yangmingshanensis]|nr:hypothetical protein CCYA_CCYA14G3667 [Cyanidiococcus yangmingshanensis]